MYLELSDHGIKAPVELCHDIMEQTVFFCVMLLMRWIMSHNIHQ